MQHNNVYERIHNALSWKRIIAFNAILFLVTVIPLSVRLAQEDTENRSSAAESPVVIPPAAYPTTAPEIERVTEWFGKKGDTVVILGKSFGNYQWESTLYIGNVEVNESNIVRWSNNILEVQIPEQARTGKVWIVVNNRQATWEGSLLLTDVSRSAQIILARTSDTSGTVSIRNGAGIVRGMIEIAHVSEPLVISSNIGKITSSLSVDSLGKKTKAEFVLDQPMGSATSQILTIEYPGIGVVEILRAELYDNAGRLVPVYADPLGAKMN